MPTGIYKRIKPPYWLGKKRPPFSEEWKRKIGLKSKSRIVSKETRIKLHLANKGKKPSLEVREKMSKAQLGRIHSKEQNEKMRIIMTGRKNAWGWKISQSLKGRKVSIEAIQKMKQALIKGHAEGRIKSWITGKKHSMESIEKMRISHKNYKPTEETKKKIREYNNRPDVLEKKRQFTINQRFPTKSTSIENKIERLLQENNIEYEKQKPIENICRVDFYIPKDRLIIQCDGCYWHKCPECGYNDLKVREKDQDITKKLQKRGYTVIRIWEHDINSNLNQCLSKIQQYA